MAGNGLVPRGRAGKFGSPAAKADRSRTRRQGRHPRRIDAGVTCRHRGNVWRSVASMIAAQGKRAHRVPSGMWSCFPVQVSTFRRAPSPTSSTRLQALQVPAPDGRVLGGRAGCPVVPVTCASVDYGARARKRALAVHLGGSAHPRLLTIGAGALSSRSGRGLCLHISRPAVTM
jgi:hypothetical protein